MPGCFGCFGRRRQSEAFLQAVRNGAVTSAISTIESSPGIEKSTTVVDRKNALHLACEEGHIVVLNAVLEVLTCQESIRSADTADTESIHSILNAQDSRGQTPLFVASALGHADCVRLLLTNGADRSVPDIRGNLPLHMSAWWGHLSITFMLLDFMLPEGLEGAPESNCVNQGNGVGLTALHLAVWGRRSGIMQVLLQHDADIGVRSGIQLQPDILLPCTSGSTPLHLAAARGSVEICKLLLKTHYERVVEPLMLDPSSAASIAAATVATANDPRMQINDAMQMPYQIAQRMGYTPLAMMLRPTISLARLFGEIDRHVPRIYGAPSLKTLATEAVNRKLEATLKQLISQEEATSALKRKKPSELVISADDDISSATAGGGGITPRRAGISLTPRSSSRSSFAASALSPSLLSPLSVLSPSTPIMDPSRPGSRGFADVHIASESPTAHRAGSRTLEAAMSLPGMVQEDEGGVEGGVDALRSMGIMPDGAAWESPALSPSHGSTEGNSISPAAPSEEVGAIRSGASGSGANPNDLNLAVSVCAAETAHDDDEAVVLSPRTPASPSGATVSPLGSEEPSAIGSDAGGDGGACYGQTSEESGRHQASTSSARRGTDQGGLGFVDGPTALEVIKESVTGALDEAEEDDECGVCLESLPGFAIVPCKHKLCGGCALKICTSDIKKPSLCPFCRTLIRNFGPLA